MISSISSGCNVNFASNLVIIVIIMKETIKVRGAIIYYYHSDTDSVND